MSHGQGLRQGHRLVGSGETAVAVQGRRRLGNSASVRGGLDVAAKSEGQQPQCKKCLAVFHRITQFSQLPWGFELLGVPSDPRRVVTITFGPSHQHRTVPPTLDKALGGVPGALAYLWRKLETLATKPLSAKPASHTGDGAVSLPRSARGMYIDLLVGLSCSAGAGSAGAGKTALREAACDERRSGAIPDPTTGAARVRQGRILHRPRTRQPSICAASVRWANSSDQALTMVLRRYGPRRHSSEKARLGPSRDREQLFIRRQQAARPEPARCRERVEGFAGYR